MLNYVRDRCLANPNVYLSAEFTTPAFTFRSSARLWLNARAAWRRASPDAKCDEGCQAYILVEMRDAAGQAVVGGRSRERCVLMDVDAQKIPLTWAAAESASEAGELTLRDGDVVSLRFFYRDATIFAVGMEPEPVG